MNIRLNYEDGQIGEFEAETFESLENGVVYVDNILHTNVSFVSVQA